MAAVTVNTTFRRGSRVFAYRIKPNGLEVELGSALADSAGTVTISGLPAGACWVRGDPLDPNPPASARGDGLETPHTVRATAV